MPTLDEIDAQIRALEDQKKQIQQAAKDKALTKANAAIEELRALGYNYRLAEQEGVSRAPRAASTGTRRTGIREEVLSAIKAAPGITRAQLLEKMGAQTKTDQTAVDNARSGLQRAGKITIENGTYKAT